MITHGHSVGGKRSGTYRSWETMKARCDNPKDPWFRVYGGAGISYDPAWKSFDRFLADMGERPEGMTLERKNGKKGYSKQNCIWATAREQTLNRSFTVWLTFKGRTQCLTDWARELGVSNAALSWRRRQGWPTAKVLGTPFKADGRREFKI